MKFTVPTLPKIIKIKLYAAAQASIMRIRDGGRRVAGGARGEGAVGARRAVRAQKIFFLAAGAAGWRSFQSCVLRRTRGGTRVGRVACAKFFSFEFAVRAFAGARGEENIFLVEAFSRA